MDSQILIFYQDYIPDEDIHTLQRIYLKNNFSNTVELKKAEQSVYNFTGEDIYDVIVYIKVHGVELTAGVLVTLVYDIVKTSIVTVWKKIKELEIFKIKSRTDYVPKEKKIAVRVGNGEKFIEICITDNFDEKEIERMLSSLSLLLNSSQLGGFLKDNKYYEKKGGKPKIKLTYNSETNKWEATDFEQLREEYKKFFEDARKRLNDLDN